MKKQQSWLVQLFCQINTITKLKSVKILITLLTSLRKMLTLFFSEIHFTILYIYTFYIQL